MISLYHESSVLESSDLTSDSTKPSINSNVIDVGFNTKVVSFFKYVGSDLSDGIIKFREVIGGNER